MNIEESLKSVLEQLIREENKFIRALCTHDVVEGVIDSVDEVCTRKVMQESSKAAAVQSGRSGPYHQSLLTYSDDTDGNTGFF